MEKCFDIKDLIDFAKYAMSPDRLESRRHTHELLGHVIPENEIREEMLCVGDATVKNWLESRDRIG